MADRAAELHGGWLWTRGGGASLPLLPLLGLLDMAC